jgi:hypothetical protein
MVAALKRYWPYVLPNARYTAHRRVFEEWRAHCLRAQWTAESLCTDTYTVISFIEVPTNIKGRATVTVKHTQRTMIIYILYTHTPAQSEMQHTHTQHTPSTGIFSSHRGSSEGGSLKVGSCSPRSMPMSTPMGSDLSGAPVCVCVCVRGGWGGEKGRENE